MAKDWKGGAAAVFKTLGASNHKNGERQREDYYATEPAATEWLCKIEDFGGGVKSSNRLAARDTSVRFC